MVVGQRLGVRWGGNAKWGDGSLGCDTERVICGRPIFTSLIDAPNQPPNVGEALFFGGKMAISWHELGISELSNTLDLPQIIGATITD